MPNEKLNSLDDYERFLYTTLEKWLPQQRVALAAAMAERWLPVYEAFSTAEQWGDPASLRRSLEAVWNHLARRSLSPADIARHTAQVKDSTPHMDDFDDEAALAACIILSEALRCCGTEDNIGPVLQAMLSGFEAVAPDWELDPAEQRRLWRQVVVRRELKTSQEYRGEVPAAAKAPKGPVAITNQTAFEQYRRMVESDLKRGDDWWQKQYVPGTTL